MFVPQRGKMKERLKQDLKEAMRSKNKNKRDTIRLLLSAIKKEEIDQQRELSEPDLNRLLQKQAKQRRDSIKAFKDAGRLELVEVEQIELDIIEAYLPTQMSVDEIRAIVVAEIERKGATSMRDMGKVMGPLMGKLRGKADGSVVQELVREQLSG